MPYPPAPTDALVTLALCERGAALVIRLETPRLDAHTAVDLWRRLGPLIGGASRRIVFDLSTVRRLDSRGLGVLVVALKQAIREEKTFALAGVRAAPRELLALTRLDRVFRIYATAEEAVGALTPARAA